MVIPNSLIKSANLPDLVIWLLLPVRKQRWMPSAHAHIRESHCKLAVDGAGGNVKKVASQAGCIHAPYYNSTRKSPCPALPHDDANHKIQIWTTRVHTSLSMMMPITRNTTHLTTWVTHLTVYNDASHQQHFTWDNRGYTSHCPWRWQWAEILHMGQEGVHMSLSLKWPVNNKVDYMRGETLNSSSGRELSRTWSGMPDPKPGRSRLQMWNSGSSAEPVQCRPSLQQWHALINQRRRFMCFNC